MLYAAKTIDDTLIEIETLKSELGERDYRISRLEDSLQERRKRVVREIKIELDVKDKLLNLKLTEVARDLVDDLIGREIDTLDPPLITTIISGRSVSINKQSYTYNVDLIVISDTLTLYLEVVEGIIEISE